MDMGKQVKQVSLDEFQYSAQCNVCNVAVSMSQVPNYLSYMCAGCRHERARLLEFIKAQGVHAETSAHDPKDVKMLIDCVDIQSGEHLTDIYYCRGTFEAVKKVLLSI